MLKYQRPARWRHQGKPVGAKPAIPYCESDHCIIIRLRNVWIGPLFALTAGLMWGLVFIAPLLLPEYPAALQAFARYLAFGLIARGGNRSFGCNAES